MTKKSIFKLEKEEKKTMSQLFWRHNWIMFGINYVRQQGVAFGWSIEPMLREIYKDDDDAFYEAMLRNTQFYNTTPHTSPFIAGLTLSMEEENSRKTKEEDFDVSSINAVKVGLMGPLAGIGDSFFIGTVRVIATGIALGFAQAGSFLGPLLFFLIVNIPAVLVRYYGGVLGYKLGNKYIQKAIVSGMLGVVTKAASVMGLMMVGAMSYQMVKFKTIFATTVQGQPLDLQNLFDSIMPGMLPLALVLVCLKMLRKNVSPVILLVAVFAIAIVLTALGITG